MSVVAFSVVPMTERDLSRSHRRRVGECTYDIRIDRTDDDRINLTVVGCDDDGQVVAELTGALPAAHAVAIGRLISRSPTGPAAYDVTHIRQRHPNAYRRWPPEDDERLAELYGKGWPIGRLANEFGRNYGAIRARLSKLGLLDAWLPAADLAS